MHISIFSCVRNCKWRKKLFRPKATKSLERLNWKNVMEVWNMMMFPFSKQKNNMWFFKWKKESRRETFSGLKRWAWWSRRRLRGVHQRFTPDFHQGWPLQGFRGDDLMGWGGGGGCCFFRVKRWRNPPQRVVTYSYVCVSWFFVSEIMVAEILGGEFWLNI